MQAQARAFNIRRGRLCRVTAGADGVCDLVPKVDFVARLSADAVAEILVRLSWAACRPAVGLPVLVDLRADGQGRIEAGRAPQRRKPATGRGSLARRRVSGWRCRPAPLNHRARDRRSIATSCRDPARRLDGQGRRRPPPFGQRLPCRRPEPWLPAHGNAVLGRSRTAGRARRKPAGSRSRQKFARLTSMLFWRRWCRAPGRCAPYRRPRWCRAGS